MRTHRFHHGGGSIRLCDGSGFIDSKFVQSAALRFSAWSPSNGNGYVLLASKYSILFNIGQGYRRLAAPGATHELVVDDDGAEVLVLTDD